MKRITLNQTLFSRPSLLQAALLALAALCLALPAGAAAKQASNPPRLVLHIVVMGPPLVGAVLLVLWPGRRLRGDDE